jgi:hypothetical protein
MNHSVAFAVMADLEHRVEVALGAELFSAPHLEVDLTRFIRDGAARMRALAARCRADGTRHVYLAGSGGSWASMWSGKPLFDRYVPVASDVLLRRVDDLDERALMGRQVLSGAGWK